MICKNCIYINGENFSSFKSVALPIIFSNGECLVVDKPANLPCRGGNISILGSLYQSLHKPYVQGLGITRPDIVFDLDGQVGGLVVIAKDKDSFRRLKNSYGSYMFELTFDLLTSKTDMNKTNIITCNLPIAKHASKNISLISARTGKQSKTEFIFIGALKNSKTSKVSTVAGELQSSDNLSYRYEHWQAKCTYLREDQIELHACESGIKILGDLKYGKTEIPTFDDLHRNFKKNKNEEEKSSPYEGIAAHLSALKLPDGSIVKTELPKKMQVFMRFLQNAR